MLLLDLDTLAPQDRVEAFRNAMNDTSVPNDIHHEDPAGGLRARVQTWRIGSLDLFDMDCTGFEVSRTSRHVRWHRDRPVISISLQTHGVHRAENGGERYTLGPTDIAVFHELSPRRYGWSGEGSSMAVTIDMEHLGLPVDSVVRASLQLRSSPCTTSCSTTCAHCGATPTPSPRIRAHLLWPTPPRNWSGPCSPRPPTTHGTPGPAKP